MKKTSTILDEIIIKKKRSLLKLKREVSYDQLERLLIEHPKKSSEFYYSLKKASPKNKIIAEIKPASPSEGTFTGSFSIEGINNAYQQLQNICAISVITEEDFFTGSTDNLRFIVANNTSNKPILRKDFIFENYQILESKVIGANAYLLIASLFSESELNELVNFGLSIGIEPLVEVHSKSELDTVLHTKARCIGVNSRDLKTFKINLKLHELLRSLGESYVRIAESGIETSQYFKFVSEFSDAALIGGYLMKSNNIKESLQKLLPKVETEVVS